MLRRPEIDENPRSSSLGVLQPDPVLDAGPEADVHSGLLSHDHPRWVSDAVAISKAARELVAKLRPILIAVRTFWDHRLRCIAVAGRRVGVDASGSYRIEI
ncbi:MAG: hypothetical protein JO092_08225 [Candidatus Eremiobacteraeota bacterium]|nr:hypothetical protein [Candidatus Eremiobacteraeota bacterium]